MTHAKHALSSVSLFVSLSVIGLSAAHADTVWLTNGDKVTGKITLLSDGKLYVTTDYADTLTISWDKVKTFQSDKGMVIQGQRYEQGVLYPAIKPGENRAVVASPNVGEGERSLPLTDIKTMVTPKSLVQDFAWKGNVDVSLIHENSSSDQTDNHSATLSTKMTHGTWRHNLDASYNMYKSDDSTSTKNAAGEYALDKFLDENWYWQTRYKYKYDWVEDIKITRSIGTGPGYQFWDNDLGAFSLTTLVGSRQYMYQTGAKDSFYTGGLKWDYTRYLFGKNTQLFTDGEIGRSFDDASPIYLTANAGVRLKLTNWSSLSLKLTREYTESRDGNTDDTIYNLGVGVNW